MENAPATTGSEVFEISFEGATSSDPTIDTPGGAAESLESSESGTQGTPTVPIREPAPSSEGAGSPAYVSQLEQRLAQAERLTNELNGAVRTMLASQQPSGMDPNRPPITPEELEANGNVGDLLRYLEWHNNRRFSEVMTQADWAARRASSVQQVRGLLGRDAVGEGRDYDSMRAKYLEPLYRANPNIEPLVNAAAFDNPALAEYTLAAVYDIVDAVKGDPVKGFKAIFGALDAYKSGAKDVTQRIGQAFDRQADRILRTTGDGMNTVKVGSADDIARMSDEQFERFYRETGT